MARVEDSKADERGSDSMHDFEGLRRLDSPHAELADLRMRRNTNRKVSNLFEKLVMTIGLPSDDVEGETLGDRLDNIAYSRRSLAQRIMLALSQMGALAVGEMQKASSDTQDPVLNLHDRREIIGRHTMEEVLREITSSDARRFYGMLFGLMHEYDASSLQDLVDQNRFHQQCQCRHDIILPDDILGSLAAKVPATFFDLGKAVIDPDDSAFQKLRATNFQDLYDGLNDALRKLNSDHERLEHSINDLECVTGSNAAADVTRMQTEISCVSREVADVRSAVEDLETTVLPKLIRETLARLGSTLAGLGEEEEVEK